MNVPPPRPADGTAGYVDALAAVLALPIDPVWLPAVVDNVRVLLGAGRALMEFELPAEVEAAPVFEP